MRKWIAPLSLLAACCGVNETFFAQSPAIKKQQEKIAALEKKLDRAQEDLTEADQEVARLLVKIDRARLQLIRRQVDEYERSQVRPEILFVEEREVLYRLIQSGQMPQALEAQIELDRILRIITERSNTIYQK